MHCKGYEAQEVHTATVGSDVHHNSYIAYALPLWPLQKHEQSEEAQTACLHMRQIPALIHCRLAYRISNKQCIEHSHTDVSHKCARCLTIVVLQLAICWFCQCEAQLGCLHSLDVLGSTAFAFQANETHLVCP